MPKRKGSPKRYLKTPEVSQLVELHAALGTVHTDIAQIVNVPYNTLRKHYHDELHLGQVKATAKVAGALYKSALEGNTTAQIFWLKTRGGWKEMNIVSHSGTIGVKRVPDDYSDEELVKIIESEG